MTRNKIFLDMFALTTLNWWIRTQKQQRRPKSAEIRSMWCEISAECRTFSHSESSTLSVQSALKKNICQLKTEQRNEDESKKKTAEEKNVYIFEKLFYTFKFSKSFYTSNNKKTHKFNQSLWKLKELKFFCRIRLTISSFGDNLKSLHSCINCGILLCCRFFY